MSGPVKEDREWTPLGPRSKQILRCKMKTLMLCDRDNGSDLPRADSLIHPITLAEEES